MSIFIRVPRPHYFLVLGGTCHKYNEAAKIMSRLIFSLLFSKRSSRSPSPITWAALLSCRSTSSIRLTALTRDPYKPQTNCSLLQRLPQQSLLHLKNPSKTFCLILTCQRMIFLFYPCLCVARDPNSLRSTQTIHDSEWQQV